MDVRNGWTAGVRPLVVFAVLVAGGPPARAAESISAPTGLLPAFRVVVPRPATSVLQRRLNGAFRRLGRPRCQDLLTEFTDAAGRPLAERLEALGRTPQSYLGDILFTDGSQTRPCASQDVLAVTNPGSRAVFVCPRQFVAVAYRDPVEAELILIHEMLHSLGLGENPPSSYEITRRVEHRCAR
jgi:hypothetical protein